MEPQGGAARVSGVKADSRSVAELYTRTWGPLIGLLVSIGGSRSDAEEVAQEAYEKLVRAWPTVGRYDDPAAWVRQVAVRSLISRHRRSRVAFSHRVELAEPDWSVDEAEDSDTRLHVRRAMGLLPVDQRAVVLLHHVYDLPVEDVARELQVPAGTVKSRLARARASLADHLRVPTD